MNKREAKRLVTAWAARLVAGEPLDVSGANGDADRLRQARDELAAELRRRAGSNQPAELEGQLSLLG